MVGKNKRIKKMVSIARFGLSNKSGVWAQLQEK